MFHIRCKICKNEESLGNLGSYTQKYALSCFNAVILLLKCKEVSGSICLFVFMHFSKEICPYRQTIKREKHSYLTAWG
jgi:hypothetical protein